MLEPQSNFMNSPLRWFLLVIGAALWFGGQHAVYNLQDDALRLADADMARAAHHQNGDYLNTYHTHLAETRNERFFFQFVKYAGVVLVIISRPFARKKSHL
jgi:hypothetical protein